MLSSGPVWADLGPFGALQSRLGNVWSHIGAWGRLGNPLGHRGGIWGRHGAILEAFGRYCSDVVDICGYVGPYWAILGWRGPKRSKCNNPSNTSRNSMTLAPSGRSGGHIGNLLGCIGGFSGAPWDPLGHLEISCGRIVVNLGRLGDRSRPYWAMYGYVVPSSQYWDQCCKY